MDFSGIILAGGRSSRMGTNKALLKIGGKTLVERACEAVAPLVRETLIITNDPERFLFLDLPTFPDLRTEQCPLVGIHAGLTHARCNQAMIVACDLPFLSTGFLRGLMEHLDGVDAVVPESEKGVEPLCAIYSRDCLPAIVRQLDMGRLKITDFFDSVRVRKIRLDDHGPHSRVLFNVNTLEDLEQAKRLIAGP